MARRSGPALGSVKRNVVPAAKGFGTGGSRSRSAVTGGGNAGDNFERPLFHVTGGIGLFGSACSDSVGFYIEPPDTTGT